MLSASKITKSFGSTVALSDACLDLRSGEVHGLLGANGAGKSTLSRIISGHIQRDTGDLNYRGKPFTIRSTRDAFDAGIVLVAQETSLVPDMTVLENIFLPELGRPGRLSLSNLRRRAEKILTRLGQEHRLPLDTEVRDLSAAGRQLVEIAKALALDASLLIFDEPTSSLSPSEVELLFDIMTTLRNDGCGMIFVSHRLEECLEITDRITILREGRTVADGLETADLTQSDIIRHMVGRKIESFSRPVSTLDKTFDGPAVLSVQNLASGSEVRNVSFEVREGEIVGLGGLVGAGRSETVEAIFGLRKRDAGEVRLDGKAINPKTPREGVAAGIGLVAEDRRAQSIIPDFTVRENMLLAFLGKDRSFGLGYKKVQDRMQSLFQSLDLPVERQNANLLTFSGGMQQKVIIARWLLLAPRVLILDEPTKGVDIATRATIYKLVRETADQGIAVVVISSDFDELLLLSDRVVAISDGVSIADLPAKSLTEEKLTLLSAPRASAARNNLMLKNLTGKFGATAFWILTEDRAVICLDIVESDGVPPVGIRAGHETRFEDTAIPLVLNDTRDADVQQGWVTEPESGLVTLIVPMRNKRGHDLGHIGLVLAPGAAEPDCETVHEYISAQRDAETSADANNEGF
ncbi:MAG: sugar ABC transporter ATP-binding protein [Paracoccaceae bacterium]